MSSHLDIDAAIGEGVIHGDSREIMPQLRPGSVDLFFTSPPYADQRAYCRIPPDEYVEWFMPFAQAARGALADSGSLAVNIKNRVAGSGPLKGQRHPYVYELVLALQRMGLRWIETYIWAKPNAMPGRFGPRPKDSFEYVYHFAKGEPYFDLAPVLVPYRTDERDIARRATDVRGRRATQAGFGRDRAKTYKRGGADPGNLIQVSQTYNQHYGVGHTAPMPECLAEFFVQALCPPGGLVVDPFAGSGTTVVVARRHGRRAFGIDSDADAATEARARISRDEADDIPGEMVGCKKSETAATSPETGVSTSSSR